MGVLLVKNVLHAALFLVACLLCIAVLYVFSNAEFLAVTQVLVYAAGILILIIFGIMITVRLTGKAPMAGFHQKTIGFALGIALFLFLAYGLDQITFSKATIASEPNTVAQWGIELATRYVAPFEVSGLLLLISLIGASLIASFPKKV
jgi:NADH-quinone oxidoreductase subunit J